MSAQLGQPLHPTNAFQAYLQLEQGVTANVSAPTLDQLQRVVARLQPAANDAAGAPAASPPASAGNASASTATPASAPAAGGGSAQTGDEAVAPTYDDVKSRVLKLAKVSKETAVEALKKFGVDHANKLKPEQFAQFIAHADQVLKVNGNA